MAAVVSPTSSPASSPSMSSPTSNPNHPPLPPLITSPPARRTALPRPPSFASKSRLSQYSAASGPSRSRPQSHVFPIFHSSLSYTLVRDFAYPNTHPLHYGPPPEPSQPQSGLSTPVSESHRRLSDPPASWENRSSWGSGSWTTEGFGKGEQLAPIHFGDGPPWSEDEDLQSPIVVSSRHRKHKSTSAAFSTGAGRGRSRGPRASYSRDGGAYNSSSHDDGHRYYVNDGNEAGGPGGEYVNYPSERTRSSLAPYNVPGQRDSHFATGYLPNRSYNEDADFDESGASSATSSPGWPAHDESRYSRDYQFTIASPDEEMHGKAVALFDFERENENELPLVEGQIIWVSYRHGQGWLVAEDPKTQESGLVPEEYVRLLRDIQGGWNSLTGQANDALLSPVANEAGTPTQAEHSNSFSVGHSSTPSNGTNGYQQPVVSTFSTSSRDLDPYPQHLLGQTGQAPQVIHYHGQRGGGSQANTPTILNPQEGGITKGSQDIKNNEDNPNGTGPSSLSQDVHVPTATSSRGGGNHESPGSAASDEDNDEDDDSSNDDETS